jgi:outer membrane protein TolC
MKHLPDARSVFAFLLLCAAPGVGAEGPQPPSARTEDSLLTLDEALSLALANNRLVRNSAIEAEKAEHEVNVARSKRLPQFHVDALAGSLLQPFDFTFPAGSFGNNPTTGPIPATHATFVTAGVDQPLTQQYKIHHGIKATELGRDMAREDLRAQRQKVAAEVRGAYFDLVAIQAAVDAAREAVKTLTEVQRVTAEHVAEHTLLRADALEVEARLLKSRYDLSSGENRLATRRELLNDLLGRDLATRFHVEALPVQDAGGLTLESARERASDNRPEVRQAQLREKQADHERRMAKAEYIPDLSLSVRYLGFYNYEVLPRNVAVAGLYLSWEPFDWKRRRNRVAQKTEAVEQARNSALQTQSQVAIEVGAKYRGWSQAALLVQAARAANEASREQFRETSNRYREQAALLKDLLQAHAQTIEKKFEYQQALSSY